MIVLVVLFLFVGCVGGFASLFLLLPFSLRVTHICLILSFVLGLLVLLLVGFGGGDLFPFLFILSVWGGPTPSLVLFIFMFLVLVVLFLWFGVSAGPPLCLYCFHFRCGRPFSTFTLLLHVRFACSPLVVGWGWWQWSRSPSCFYFRPCSEREGRSSQIESRIKKREEPPATKPNQQQEKSKQTQHEEKRPEKERRCGPTAANVQPRRIKR